MADSCTRQRISGRGGGLASGRRGPCHPGSLAEADVFATLGIGRRQALWDAKALRAPKALPLFDSDMDGESIHEPLAQLPQMSPGEHVVEDYVAMRLSLRAHPLALLRGLLTPEQAA